MSMLSRFLGLAVTLAVLIGLGLWLTRPERVEVNSFSDLSGDAARGKQVFIASGCASCHHAPQAVGEARLVLAGGQVFDTPFGRFVAPNISPDPEEGLGNWTIADFASALRFGSSPDGRHYYPAFPYAAYTRMTNEQIADLWSYTLSLPEDDTPSRSHDLKFPFSIRQGIGIWKLLYLDDDWVLPQPESEELLHGRMLVEALAHCGECHTPRDAFGGLDRESWLVGAPNSTGSGTIPGLTADQLDWSKTDIAYYLETGFTPDYDSAGGHMVSVIENFAQLAARDRESVAAYIKALPSSE